MSRLLVRVASFCFVVFGTIGCGGSTERTSTSTAASGRAGGRARSTPQQRDDGSIPVTRRVARAGGLSLALDGSLLLADDGADVAVLDAATGGIRARFAPLPRVNGFDDQPRAAAFGSVIVHEPVARVLVASGVDGTERWRTACIGASFDVCRVRGALAGGVIVLASGRSIVELVARDATTGAERWRFTPDTGVSWDAEAIATDGTRIFVATYASHRLVALDGATGARVWEADCDAGWTDQMGRGPGQCARVSSAGGRVATIAISGSEVHVLDAATGTRIRHLFGRDLGMGVIAAVLAGDALLLGGIASAEAGVVTVVDLATGTTRWTVHTPEPVRSLVGRADGVWARGIYGTLWRLDHADGHVLARWGFARGHAVIAVGDRLVVDDGNDVAWIDPALATDRDPEWTVRGIASLETEEGARTAGLRVRVGDVVVTTNDIGAFEARLRARGGVHAWVEGDPASPCDEVDNTVFVAAAALRTSLSLRRVSRRCRGE